ncbi:MAG TPA: hypothetical protein VLE95_01385, partial [Chlamydiales bacterium]|nr:hypothetical protein [Chlamydiales bacterium]
MYRILFLLLLYLKIQALEIIVDLRNPTYQNGILFTDEGGVVKSKELRIQAQIIEYTHTKTNGKEIQQITAQGDLLIQYKGLVFVGEKLEYDFAANTGTLFHGKTLSSLWFISGEKIALHSDGSYVVENASITTSENKDSDWDVYAKSVIALKPDLFIAKNIAFRLFKIPTFWLPSLKLNLKKTNQDPVLRYFLDWDRGQGARAGMRCQLYSWRDFSLFGRIEYRWSTGWGGAIESEYFPPHGQTTFITRSYVGTDRLETAPNKQFRFRLEGAHHWKSQNGRTNTTLSWDKYSDVRMPSDFKSEDFEIAPAKQTLFWAHHQSPFLIANFKARPKVNVFESIKQDLPTFYLHTLPVNLASSGIISSFFFKSSYVDFSYSDQLAKTPTLTPPMDYRSGRFEAREKLHRPFFLGPLTVTPNFGATGILYTNSSSHDIQPLGFLNYGADVRARAARIFETHKHVLEPYAGFLSLTRPTIRPDDHYIFSIADGYNQINQIQGGIRSFLYHKDSSEKGPWFTADLSANGFVAAPAIHQWIPYLYFWLEWRLPSIYLSLQNVWNFRNSVWDRSNAICKWTINENIALSLEARYRSEFDW